MICQNASTIHIPSNPIAEIMWEKLDCKNQPAGGLGAWRAKVPGGWLLACVVVVKAAASPSTPIPNINGIVVPYLPRSPLPNFQ